jgi:hypothetical protein
MSATGQKRTCIWLNDAFRLPSAGNSSYNGIFTTVTEVSGGSSHTGFEASLSDLDVRALLAEVRIARRVDLKQLGEGK